MLSLLRRNRDFRAGFVAQVISYCGDWFATVALLGYVHDLVAQDRRALALSLVWVSQFLPGFLVTPLSGVVADRFDRRTVMVIVSAAQTLAALLLLFIGPGRVWIAFAGQGLISLLGAFFGPASQAALPNLVDPPDLPTATTMMSATWGAMLAIGAGVGAVFTVLFGRKAAFVADAVSFAAAALLIRSIRRPTQEPSHAARGRVRPLADTMEALSMARRQPTLMALLLSKAGNGLATGIVGLLAVMATTRYSGGDGITGVFLVARGVGVVAGPIVAKRFVGRGGVSALLIACAVSSVIYGAGYAVVATIAFLPLTVVLIAIAHTGGGAQWTLSTYGLQVATPDAYRGRIMAADFALVTLTMSISLFVGGTVADHIGFEPVMLALSAVSVLWGIAYFGIGRRLRTTAPAAPASAT